MDAYDEHFADMRMRLAFEEPPVTTPRKLSPSDFATLPAQPADDVQARLPGEQFPADKFIGKIKGMLVGEEYAYAESTLRGILSTVTSTGRVSQPQRDAVDRIADRPTRGRDRRRTGGW